MNAATGYLIGLIFACATAFVGRCMASNPEKTSRFFTFGQISSNLTVSFCRFVGRFFLVMSILGAILYMILIPLALLGFKYGQFSFI